MILPMLWLLVAEGSDDLPTREEASAIIIEDMEVPERHITVTTTRPKRLRAAFPLALVLTFEHEAPSHIYVGVVGPGGNEVVESQVFTVVENVWGEVQGSQIEAWSYEWVGARIRAQLGDRFLALAFPFRLQNPGGIHQGTIVEPTTFAAQAIRTNGKRATLRIRDDDVVTDLSGVPVCIDLADDTPLYVDCPEGQTTSLQEAIDALRSIPWDGVQEATVPAPPRWAASPAPHNPAPTATPSSPSPAVDLPLLEVGPDGRTYGDGNRLGFPPRELDGRHPGRLRHQLRPHREG